MTPAQQATIRRKAEMFGCWPDDVQTRTDVVPGWVIVTIGEEKQRPKTFAVDESARPVPWSGS